MKKLLSLVCLSVSLTASLSAQEVTSQPVTSRDSVQIVVDQTLAYLPLPMGDIAVIDTAYVKGDDMVYRCQTKPVHYQEIVADLPNRKRAVMAQYYIDANNHILMELLYRAGMNLSYVYCNSETGEVCPITVTYQDIVAMKNGEHEISPYELMKLQVEPIQKSLPQNLGNGLVVDAVELTKASLVYHCMVDESLVNLSVIADNKENVKMTMGQALLSDIVSMNLVKWVIQAKMAMGYVYEGSTSHERVEILFRHDELRLLMLGHSTSDFLKSNDSPQ